MTGSLELKWLLSSNYREKCFTFIVVVEKTRAINFTYLDAACNGHVTRAKYWQPFDRLLFFHSCDRSVLELNFAICYVTHCYFLQFLSFANNVRHIIPCDLKVFSHFCPFLLSTGFIHLNIAVELFVLWQVLQTQCTNVCPHTDVM